MAEKKEQKYARFKTTPEGFIQTWFEQGFNKDNVAAVFNVSEQTISKYASALRKKGVELPFAKRQASEPKAKAPVDVVGLNALIKNLSAK